MRPVFVCTRCQLLARLHKRIRVLQEARRGFVNTPHPYGIQARAVPSGTGLHPGRTPQHQQRPTQQPPGRYSRGALQPETVLSELESTPDEPRAKKNAPITNGERRQRSPIAQRRIDPFKELNVKLEAFRNFSELSHAEAEKVLQEIAANPTRDQLAYALIDDRRFCKAFSGFILQTCRMIVEHKPEAQSRVWAMVSPSELLKAGQAFGLGSYLKDRHVEVMWRLASRLVELRPSVQMVPELRPWYDGLLDELVMLWKLALEISFRRHGTTQSTTFEIKSEERKKSIDWSFLPSDTARFLSSLEPMRKTIRSFQSTIELLVPAHHTNWNPRSQEHYEYESTALVTLDELRLRAPSGDSQAEQSWENYRPLMHFFEDILKASPVMTMPVSLAEKLKSSAKQEFEFVLGRVGLQRGTSGRRRLSEHSSRTDMSRTSSVEEETGKIVATSAPAGNKQDPVQDVSSDAAPVSGKVVTSDIPDDRASSGPDEAVDVRSSLDVDAVPRTDIPVSGDQDLGPHAAYVNNQLKFLGRAWQHQSLPQALRCKREILAMAREAAGKDLPNKLFEHLMLTFLALRNPQEALGVWNFFVTDLGRQPTAQTYTVMMRGSQYVRDVRAMEAFWAKMCNAGIKPDAHAWSTRIFGLIKSNNSVMALRALDDLGKEWLRGLRMKESTRPALQLGQIKSDIGDPLPPSGDAATNIINIEAHDDVVTKPNIVVMNAAISAFASKDEQWIPKVLGWGHRFGLEPDRVTYNVLLNVSMRHGKADEAIAILHRMSAKGIDPDSQTYTILLTAVFEGDLLKGLEHDEQEARIMTLITSLDTVKNVAIDQKGYALIIDRLLAWYNNIHAANTVLQHMISANIQPTTHILTILMRSYFQRRPIPDFAAAEALWTRVMNPETGFNVSLDSIFYDRMIEWYAQSHSLLGSTQPMMNFLNRMLRERRRPSWRAMELAMRALAERGERSKFMELLAEARKWNREEEVEIVVGQRNFGQRDFWQFVIGTGALREEGIWSATQVIRPSVGVGPLERGMQGVGG